MSEPKRTRLYALGFGDRMVANTVLEQLKMGISRKDIVVEDYALIHKDQGGKVTTQESTKSDPGAARGGVFGGAAGAVLAVISGPIGVGAVVGGAAIGAVTAALRDSGFSDDKLRQVSTLMADGRTGILVSVPLESADQFDEYIANDPVFAAADRTYHVDIVPGRDFERAMDEYRRAEANEP
jgi:uncharacterized membrane protein